MTARLRGLTVASMTVKIGGREYSEWTVVAVSMLLGLAFSAFLIYVLPHLLR